MLGGSSITLFHVRGIRISVDWSWFFILFLVIVWLSNFYGDVLGESGSSSAPFLLALASAVGFFGSIVLHELGHAFAALRNGIGISGIQLWIFGGMAHMDRESDSPATEFKVAIAGPLVTLAIVVALSAVGLAAVGGEEFRKAALVESDSGVSGVLAMIAWLATINFLVLVFNLLPAFPLDGGRVARSLIWGRRGDLSRATTTAAAIGRGFGYAMIGFGVLGAAAGAVGGIWFAVIGFFVIVAAKAEEGGLRVRTAFAGREAGRFMSFPAVAVPAGISVERAIEDYFVKHRYTAFPVIDERGPIGLIDIGHVEKVPPQRHAATTVAEAMVCDPELVIDEHQDVAELLEQPAFQRLGRAIVRTERGELGIVSTTDVNRALRALELRSGHSMA